MNPNFHYHPGDPGPAAAGRGPARLARLAADIAAGSGELYSTMPPIICCCGPAYGVPATYVRVTLLAFLIDMGVHNGGGSLSVSNALYFLLLVGVALVLDDPVAVDVTVALCLIAYSGLASMKPISSRRRPGVSGALPK